MNTVHRLLRRSLSPPATALVAGVPKTPRNTSNHTWLCSFFHEDFKSTISLARIVMENQKRSKKRIKIKNTNMQFRPKREKLAH
jgi:hypothetical protein